MTLRTMPLRRLALATGLAVAAPSGFFAQDEDEEKIYEMSPFTVDASQDDGYRATNTLAGTRIKTDLKDIGTSIEVVTKEFLDDIGAVSLEDVLLYTTNTEVGGVGGNFSGFDSVGDGANLMTDQLRAEPQSATRVRGLGRADLTRGYFKTLIPFDTYNSSRLDINRGSNSTLFGLGSPAGIVNNNVEQASFRDGGEFVLRFDDAGSVRASVNLNRVLLEDKLAVRFAVLRDETEWEQEPTFSDTNRRYAALTFKPLKNTTLRATYEEGDTYSRRPDTIGPLENLTSWFENGQPIVDQRIATGIGLVGGTGIFVDGVEILPSQIRAQDELVYAQRSYDGAFLAADSWRIAGGRLRSNAVPLQTLDGNVAIANARLFDEGILVVQGANATTFDGIGFVAQPNNNINRAGDALANLGDGTDEVRRFMSIRNIRDMYTLEGETRQGLLDYAAFNFGDNLIGGGTSFQDTEFDATNVALEQTFMDNKFGFEIALDKQNYAYEGFHPVQHGNALIWVDVNVLLPNGELNPNVGRPYTHAEGAHGGKNLSSETRRLTAFARHDFGEQFDSGWMRWLGSHVLTGLLDNYEDHNFTYSKALVFNDPDFQRMTANIGDIGPNGAFSDPIIYVGPSIMDARSLADVQLTGASHDLNIWRPGESFPITYWDSGANDNGERNTVTADVVAEGQLVTRDIMLHETYDDKPRSAYSETKSKALVLQSKFFANHLVTTYGWRDDEVTETTFDKVTVDPVTQEVLMGELENGQPDIIGDAGDRTSFGAVFHWPRAWGLPEKTGLSFHYAKSSNFSLGNREDWELNKLDNPSGETIEQGVSIQLFENKLNLRFNQYETSLVGASSKSYVNTFDLFRLIEERFNEADVEGVDPVWQDFHRAVGDSMLAALPAQLVEGNSLNYTYNDAGMPTGFTFTNAPVTDTEDRVAKGEELEITYNPSRNWRIKASIARQETVKSNIAPVFTNSGKAFLDKYYATPVPGYEWITFGELPTHRGFAQGSYILDVAGQRFLSGTTDEASGEFTPDAVQFENHIERYENDLVALRTAKSAEGARSSEQREWRFSIMTNYSFREGRFKGLSVGGAYRWQDQAALGYPFILNDDGQVVGDISDPIFGDELSNLDLFASYAMPFFKDHGKWKMQLNVRNAFASDDFVPIQLAGRPIDGGSANVQLARVRAPAPTQYILTSTFAF